MGVEILVHRAHGETRVALLEDGKAKELYFERDSQRGVVNNIYRGRVTRVLPGMQAAFVNIGLTRAAFLYVGDVLDPSAAPIEDVDEDEEALPPFTEHPLIQDLLQEGQELTVQVTKTPLGTKGARVSTYVTLPGRYVVYMPTMRRIGVSRKITAEDERKRLRDVLTQLQADDEGGFIARTVCEGLDAEQIAQDVQFVKGLWAEVSQKAGHTGVPALLAADLGLALRTTRDLFNETVDRMILNNPSQAEQVRRLLRRSAPHLVDRVVLDERPNLFGRYEVERTLESALERQVPLQSGGSIVIDEAEALTAIDVNTGRYVGSNDLEATLLKTNLEAAEAIAAQIRLRNLGGLIIVDFIDMQLPESRLAVEHAFAGFLAQDRAKTHMLPMSDFCLVELTRKRVRGSLDRLLREPCPYCQGRGRVRSLETMAKIILRAVERESTTAERGSIMVRAMPKVAALIAEDSERSLARLEERIGRTVVIEASNTCHQEHFQVWVRPPGEGQR